MATVPPGASAVSADTTTDPTGSERDRSVQRRRRRVVIAADRIGAEAAGDLVFAGRPREQTHLTAPVLGHLDREVGGGSEPEQAQPLPRLDPAEHQRSVPDDAAAKEGRRLLVREPLGEREHEIAAGSDAFGVPAVHRPAGELGLLAQILEPSSAVVACAVRAPQPRQPDTFAGGEAADRRVAGRVRRIGRSPARSAGRYGRRRTSTRRSPPGGQRRLGRRPSSAPGHRAVSAPLHASRDVGYHADSRSARLTARLNGGDCRRGRVLLDRSKRRHRNHEYRARREVKQPLSDRSDQQARHGAMATRAHDDHVGVNNWRSPR